MKNGTILTTAAVLVATAGAFFAGRSSVSSDAAAESSSSPIRSARIERSSSSEFGSSRRAASRSASRSQGSASATERESSSDEMRRIVSTTDPLERAQAWLDFLNTLDPSEFESVVADFRGANLTRENMGEYKMLLTAWAKNDPLAALDYAAANTGNRIARNTILTSWATTDPEAAISWATSNHEGEGANPWMVGVIRGLASSDPTRATELMSSMPRSEERGEALSAILPTILKQGNDAAKAWIASIDDDSLRDGAMSRLAEDFARKDPKGTAEWLAANPGDGARRSIDDVMGIWVDQNKSAATAYYNNLPAGDLRSGALRGITNKMAMTDPKAAADFLDANAGDANDGTYQQFVWHSFGSDPETAANYIAKIENPNEQEGMYRRMLDGWLRRDFDSASNWINSTTLPENVNERVGRRMEELQQRQQ